MDLNGLRYKKIYILRGKFDPEKNCGLFSLPQLPEFLPSHILFENSYLICARGWTFMTSAVVFMSFIQVSPHKKVWRLNTTPPRGDDRFFFLICAHMRWEISFRLYFTQVRTIYDLLHRTLKGNPHFIVEGKLVESIKNSFKYSECFRFIKLLKLL